MTDTKTRKTSPLPRRNSRFSYHLETGEFGNRFDIVFEPSGKAVVSLYAYWGEAEAERGAKKFIAALNACDRLGGYFHLDALERFNVAINPDLW